MAPPEALDVALLSGIGGRVSTAVQHPTQQGLEVRPSRHSTNISVTHSLQRDRIGEAYSRPTDELRDYRDLPTSPAVAPTTRSATRWHPTDCSNGPCIPRCYPIGSAHLPNRS